jgi:hypothetical protein
MTNLFDPATPTGKMLRDMWHEVQLASEKNAVAAAKADPEKHKLSKLIADNKPASYRYYPVKYCPVVRWCWANNPNIAGYYLSWREIKTRSTIKRTQFKAHKHRYLGEMRCREKAKENQ